MSKINEHAELLHDLAVIEAQAEHFRSAGQWADAREAQNDALLLRNRIWSVEPEALAEVQAERAEEQRRRDAAAARQNKAEAERKRRCADQLDALTGAAIRLDMALAGLACPYVDVVTALAALEHDGALKAMSTPGYGFNVAGALLAATRAAIPKLAGDLIAAGRNVGPMTPLVGAAMANTVARIRAVAMTGDTPPPRHERDQEDAEVQIARASQALAVVPASEIWAA